MPDFPPGQLLQVCGIVSAAVAKTVQQHTMGIVPFKRILGDVYTRIRCELFPSFPALFAPPQGSIPGAFISRDARWQFIWARVFQELEDNKMITRSTLDVLKATVAIGDPNPDSAHAAIISLNAALASMQNALGDLTKINQDGERVLAAVHHIDSLINPI